MRRSSFTLLTSVAGVFISTLHASGQVPSAALRPSWGATYQETRTWHEQKLALNPSPEDRLAMLRSLVRAGPHSGGRRLANMFKNFEGPYSIDPSIPGVEKTVRLTASINNSQVRGASRTLVYAQQIYNDPRFKLLSINEPISARYGKTDKDLRYRHQVTGAITRMEVKEVTAASQRANLQKYRLQINKMAEEFRTTGERQVWVNRKEVIPELKQYAHRRGIQVYDNVATSTGAFGEVRQLEEWQMQRQAVLNASAGGVQIAMGAFLLYHSAPVAYENLVASLDATTRSDEVLLRLGEHGSFTVAGTGMTTSGAAILGSRFTNTLSGSSRMLALSRWSGRLGIAATVAAEGFILWQYQRGVLKERDFWHAQAGLGGGLAGGAAGGWIGFKAGALGGAAVGAIVAGPAGAPVGAAIGGTIGAVGGGVGGGYIGSTIGIRGVSSYYEFKDQAQERRFVEFLYHHYGI